MYINLPKLQATKKNLPPHNMHNKLLESNIKSTMIKPPNYSHDNIENNILQLYEHEHQKNINVVG